MYLISKRIIDFTLALAALVVFSPLFLFLIIAVKLGSEGPVFFKQRRVGIHKTHFSIIKFRTMRISAPKNTPTHLLRDPERYTTSIGKLLRRTSLDELPQVWNILVGQMSFVGPRPALWNQYDLIAERDKYGANGIKPGLTGWAQIHGRDRLSIKTKARLDGEYARKMSFGLDIKCFLGTVLNVLRGDDILEGGTGALRRKNSRQK